MTVSSCRKERHEKAWNYFKFENNYYYKPFWNNYKRKAVKRLKREAFSNLLLKISAAAQVLYFLYTEINVSRLIQRKIQFFARVFTTF